MTLLYKLGKMVTRREPCEPCLSIDVESEDIVGVTRFLKYAVSDIEELNYIKNDISFLVNELYARNRHRRLFNSSHTGSIIYIWVYIPIRTQGAVIHDVLFPFDLFHLPRVLSPQERQRIHSKILDETDNYLYFRDQFQPPPIPYVMRLKHTDM